jgi:hypothetical protein
MKVMISVFLALLVTFVLTGCSSKEEDKGGGPPITAPINNNAPEAKNAPAAPDAGPGVPKPGGKRGP